MKSLYSLRCARVPAIGVSRYLAALWFVLSVTFITLRAQTPPAPWQSLDIGATGAAGTTNYNSGTGQFTIEGAGDDIWGTGDQFRYVYQTVSGDFAIVAKVESVENTFQWAKAGVMIRESTGTSAQYAFCLMTPSATNGGKWEYRSGTTSAGTTQFVPNPSLPHWVKVVRAGNVFTAYESANGTSWTQAGTAQTITMGQSVQIGLAVCSSITGTLCTAVFSNVSVTNGLPSGWSTADVGTVGLTGSASYASSTFTVNGAGTEVYGTADSFRYVYQTVTGDSTIVARVATEQNSNQWAKVGVMFRDDDPAHEPAARYVFLALTPDSANDRGFLFEYRGTAGGGAAQNINDATGPNFFAPYWLKLVRSGNTFSAFRSTDNQTWSAVGTPQAVTLNATTRVGLAVCSHVLSPYALNTSTFTNVSVLNDTTPPTVAMTAPTGGANVSGTAVTVSANASDNYSVANVQFQLDGTNLGSADTTSPYSIVWDSTLVPNGSHSLTAVATDSSGNPATATPVSVTVSNSLPAPWIAGDIGSPAIAGTANFSNNTFFIDGAGTNIWNTSDQFQFVRQSVNGDCVVVARVTGVENTNAWAKAGIMIRDTLADTSRYVLLCLTPNNSLMFEARTDTVAPGNSSQQLALVSNVVAPQWVRMVRSGNTFSASYSSDGQAWSTAGMAQSTVVVPMGSSTYAGLEVCSINASNACTATFESASVTATPAYNPTFPRLGIYAIGPDQAYPNTFWPVLSKFHVVIINGGWEDWATPTRSRSTVVNGIKGASAIGTKVFQYVILEAIKDGKNGAAQDQDYPPQWTSLIPVLNQNNWWVFPPGIGLIPPANFSQTNVNQRPQTSFFSNDMWMTNMTAWAPTDPATGLRPWGAGAQYFYDAFIAGLHDARNAAPTLDGFFLDNVLWKPRKDADWNRNGVVEVGSSPNWGPDSQYNADTQLAVRTGEKDFFDKIRLLMPGAIQIGNNADFPNATTDPFNNLNAIQPLNQVLQGGVCEYYIGKSFSYETTAGYGTLGMMARYKYVMDSAAPPKLQLFEQSNLNPNGTEMAGPTNPDTTPYRAMRYGLACCLMNDGYYNAEQDNHWADSRILWFDEFSVYQGVAQLVNGANTNAGLGYLGQPTESPRTGPRWPPGGNHGPMGVWAREFQNGIVIMNPKGNGLVTLTSTDLGGATVWKHISGTQAPTINDGTNVTGNISLTDRDGIILLRR